MQMVAWLKVHILPLKTVTEYMRETFIYRAKWIQEHGTSRVYAIFSYVTTQGGNTTVELIHIPVFTTTSDGD